MIKKEYKNILILIGILLLIIFITTGFNIFGSDTDWLNQHTIIPDYFRKTFYETGNILPNFSFNYGAGENIFNLSYYGFLSPIVLLSYLFPFIKMSYYLIGINVIILIISVILFYKWLRDNKFNSKMSLLISIIFITSGPLIFHMHRHMMFVNYMPFLILGLIGIDKLIKDNKKILLIISIFLMIMTSFYYSVGGIIVLLIYFIYKSIKSKDLIKKIFLFLFYILIAVLMSGILIIPTIYTLIGSRNNDINMLNLIIPSFDTTRILYGAYSLGLTFISLASILWMFYSKKKNNAFLGISLVIMFFVPLFTYLLNGGLYLRGKVFIPFIPLVCLIIGKFLNELFNKKTNIKDFVIYLFIINILAIVSNVVSILYYIDVVSFIIILLLYNKYNNKKIMYIYIIGISLFTGLYMNFNEDYVTYREYNELYQDNYDLLTNIDNNYRVSNLIDSSYNVNNIYTLNQKTTNIYSSTYNKYYYNFLRNIYKVSNPYYNSFLLGSVNDIMFNTLMGNRYVINYYNPGNGYKFISNNNKYRLYENNNAFSIGFANSNIMSKSYFDMLTYPYNIEALLNYIIIDDNAITTYVTKIEKYEEPYSKIMTGINTKNNIYEVSKKGEMDIYFKESLNNKIIFIEINGLKENICVEDEISITINGIKNSLTCKNWIYPNNNNIFHYVINEENIDKLHIEFSKGTYNIDEFEMYILDYNNIVKNYDNLIINDVKDDTIYGNIEVTSDGYFMLTIPYDKGFEIYFNDKKMDYELVDDSFMGFKINQGNYNVKIVYNSPGLNYGKISSVIGIILLLGVIGKEVERKHKNIV